MAPQTRPCRMWIMEELIAHFRLIGSDRTETNIWGGGGGEHTDSESHFMSHHVTALTSIKTKIMGGR
jgi:hypothetical protein